MSSFRSLGRHPEEAVVGADGVAVGGDPQVAPVVEGDVVRAGDRRDRTLVAAEVGARLARVAADQEQVPGERGGAGVAVPLDEGYPLGITDATPLVAKIRASGAQVVFPVSYLNDSLLIIRAMRQQGLDLPAVGGAAGVDSRITDTAVAGLTYMERISISPAAEDGMGQSVAVSLTNTYPLTKDEKLNTTKNAGRPRSMMQKSSAYRPGTFPRRMSEWQRLG